MNSDWTEMDTNELVFGFKTGNIYLARINYTVGAMTVTDKKPVTIRKISDLRDNHNIR